jgi:hypothetical protein
MSDLTYVLIDKNGSFCARPKCNFVHFMTRLRREKKVQIHSSTIRSIAMLTEMLNARRLTSTESRLVKNKARFHYTRARKSLTHAHLFIKVIFNQHSHNFIASCPASLQCMLRELSCFADDFFAGSVLSGKTACQPV